MGLNDIELTPALLSALYPATLVETEVVAPKETDRPESAVIASKPVTSAAIQATANWKYLGNNSKHILIVVDYPEVLHLPDEELNFLTKMLTACKLDLGDVAIFNRHNHPEVSAKELLAYFNSKTVFLFGVPPLAFGLPVDFPHYQVQQLAQSKYLFTPPLETRHTDQLLKSKLWVSLQRIFGI